MKLFDIIERKFLFSLTRGLAMIFIALFAAAMVVGAIFLSSQFKGESTKVYPNEIVAAITPAPAVVTGESTTPATPQSDPNALPGIKLPFVLQKHFATPENIRILNRWISGLSRETRQEFVDEMAAAVVEAEKSKFDGADAINKFREIKLQKINDAKAAAIVMAQSRLYYAAAAFSAILLVALLSLILVLLAIERNTRKDDVHGAV